MSIDERTKGYGTIWTDWTIGELIGHGSGGKTAVYNLTRENPGFVEADVLKIVNLIEEDVSIEDMSDDFKADYEEKKKEAIRKATEEVKLMHKLRNSMNIVSYQDFKIHTTNTKNSTHTDLLIRMHKYSELGTILKKNLLSEKEIIHIGIDICSALEDCQKEGIIHRDIKPGNIFFDGQHYLLGDFGISKIIEDGNLAQTCKGTPQYAAPEQFNGLISKNGYDHRVDIYSLGLTMYYIANKCKLPFVEQGRNLSAANLMRLEKTPIPSIQEISDELNKIIIKACKYMPEERYQSASEMKEALLRIGIDSSEKKAESIRNVNQYSSLETEAALGYGRAENDVENIETCNIAEKQNEKKENCGDEPEISVDELKKQLVECIRSGDTDRGDGISKKLANYADMKILYYEANNKYSNEMLIRNEASSAIFWYEKCIELCKDSWTVSMAEYQLGEIYLKGIGIDRNVKRAESLFSSSASKGNPYAMKKFVAGKFIK